LVRPLYYETDEVMLTVTPVSLRMHDKNELIGIGVARKKKNHCLSAFSSAKRFVLQKHAIHRSFVNDWR
jgi:hypothetical protein